MVANFRPCCPPRKVYLCFWETGVYPAGGYQMRGQLPAGGCQMQTKSCKSSLNSGLITILIGGHYPSAAPPPPL